MTDPGNTSATEQEIKMAARDLAAYFRAQARYGHTSNVVEILEHAEKTRRREAPPIEGEAA